MRWLDDWKTKRAEEKQRAKELAEVKAVVEMMEWEKERNRIIAEIREEERCYGKTKEFSFDTRAEADAFLQGVRIGSKNGDRITRILRLSEWRFKLNIKDP